MWLLRIVLFVALLTVLVLVALANDQPVDVHLLGKEFLQIRLFLVMFASALIGLVAGLIFTAVRETQLRMLMSRQMREKSRLQQEIQHLRAAPVEGLGERQDAEPGGPTRPLP